MAANTSIEWADHTFNPWTGCQAVSPGCAGCYAEAWAKRAGRDFTQRTLTKTWGNPLRWNREHEAFYAQHRRRQRVFCASLADVFDNQAPAAWRIELLRLIEATPHLDWLLLTKRIGNAVQMVHEAGAIAGKRTPYLPRNAWLGATVVNQEEVDRDVPKLLQAGQQLGAAGLFLSIEPMLGPIDLWPAAAVRCCNADESGGVDPETGAWECCRVCDFTGYLNTWGIDWVIAGGESGPKARPMHPDWPRSLRDQCRDADVPFLFKQWGEWVPSVDRPESESAGYFRWPDGSTSDRSGKKAAGRALDGMTHDGFPIYVPW